MISNLTNGALAAVNGSIAMIKLPRGENDIKNLLNHLNLEFRFTGFSWSPSQPGGSWERQGTP